MTNIVLNRKLRFQITKLCISFDSKFHDNFKFFKILELRPRNRMEMLVLRYSRAAKPVSYEITLTTQKSMIIYMFLDSKFYDDFKSVNILELRLRNRMKMLLLRYSRAAKPVSYEITLTIQKSIITYMFLDSKFKFSERKTE